jgi:opacity protein-like surface antigen
MKKTAILAIAAATMFTTSIGFAAPLTDYSAGKTSIDLTWRNTDFNAKASEELSFGKKSILDWGITTGLGSNFALQYSGYNPKSKDVLSYSDPTVTETVNLELKTQEFNVLYKLNQNVSVYTGIVKVKGTANENDTTNGITTPIGFESNSKNKLQFGLMGSTKIAEKTTAYAQFGVASDFTNWKVGLSQEIAPNLELNLDYRRLQVKKLTFNNGLGDVDMTVKGLGLGVSYKF